MARLTTRSVTVALSRRPLSLSTSTAPALGNPSVVSATVPVNGQNRSFGSKRKNQVSIPSSSSSSSSNSNSNNNQNNFNFNNNEYRINSLTFTSNNMTLKRGGGGIRFFSKVPISSPNEEGKPWYQPELDPKYSTAAKELEEENEGLEESDAPWEPEPDQEEYEEVAKFLLEAGKYELGIDLCGRMVKKYGYKLTPELVGLVREAAEKEPKFLAMAVKVLG